MKTTKNNLLYLLFTFFSAILVLLMFSVYAHAQEHVKTYQPTWKALTKHKIPDWLLDAKFGIYAHWGPYSVPAYGNEWYARRMHQQGGDVNQHHIETYGGPAEYPYHKFVPEFKAENFDADEWADLIKNSGAKYGGFAVVHHDGFLLWDSDVNRWNAGNMGPKKDLFGNLTEALRERDIKTIATFHHLRTFNWYLPEDKQYLEELKRKGSPLFDPEYGDLYWNGYTGDYEDFLNEWKAKVKEVIDKYRPDVLWFDGGRFQEDLAKQNTLEVLSYYYNMGQKYDKEVEVLNKLPTSMEFNFPRDMGILTYEEGRDRKGYVDWPWIDDQKIGIGSWGYVEGMKFKTTNQILDGFVDRVSRGGGLVLSLSPKADGSISAPQKQILLEMGEWLDENGEAIYGTGKWKIQAEGDEDKHKVEGRHKRWKFDNCTAEDIRFTQKDNNLYAIALGIPENGKIKIRSLSYQTKVSASNKIQRIELLGAGEVEWQRDNEILLIELPNEVPNELALAFRIDVEGELDGSIQ